MPPTIKDLGLIKAVHEGLTPPVNTSILWYDTNTGVNKIKYYNTVTSTWTSLIPVGGVMYKGPYSNLVTTPPSPVSGDLYVMTVAGTLTWPGVTFSPSAVVEVGDLVICYDATNWDVIQGNSTVGTSKYFASGINLIANTPLNINHGLSLVDKDSFVARVCDSSGGDINLKIVSVDTNNLTIESNIALTNVKITVIG